MSRWSHALAAVAATAVGAGMLGGAYLTVEPIVRVGGAAEPDATPSPTASPSAAASPSPTVTGIDEDCEWDALPETARPAMLVDEAQGLPAARGMTDAAWWCVDQDWTAEARSAGGDTWRPGGTAQALYLVAPDGDLLKLFDLRTDVEVVVLDADLEARLAWTARESDAETTQVVQVELDTGLVVDDWGGAAVPDAQRSEGTVVDVAPLPQFGGEGALWAGYSPSGTMRSLFVREPGGTFRALDAQRAIDSLVAQGSVDAAHEPGVEIWTDRAGTLAMILAQDPVPVEAAEDASAKEIARATKKVSWRSSGGTWVVVDLATDQWRLAEARLPRGLCHGSTGTALPGTYASPGPLVAECDVSADERGVFALALDADPVSRDSGP
ncbi:hypothetical protein [Demequina gelatinilytica]|uniref:hypothetical protein n=1 Tax=Demequina gelatinilytica TaxID=1638980 RepID=UPI000785FCFC|nr:hypothetical protein [Demequina gelatinilytica]